jgi:hypothetical protein
MRIVSTLFLSTPNHLLPSCRCEEHEHGNQGNGGFRRGGARDFLRARDEVRVFCVHLIVKKKCQSRRAVSRRNVVIGKYLPSWSSRWSTWKTTPCSCGFFPPASRPSSVLPEPPPPADSSVVVSRPAPRGGVAPPPVRPSHSNRQTEAAARLQGPRVWTPRTLRRGSTPGTAPCPPNVSGREVSARAQRHVFCLPRRTTRSAQTKTTRQGDRGRGRGNTRTRSNQDSRTETKLRRPSRPRRAEGTPRTRTRGRDVLRRYTRWGGAWGVGTGGAVGTEGARHRVCEKNRVRRF